MKKVLLFVCVLLASLTLSAYAAEPDGVAFDFGEMYIADGKPVALPHTFEATVYIPEGIDTTKRAGTVLSTYTGLDTYYFIFDVMSDGSKLYPRFEWTGLYNKSTDSMLRQFNFKNAVLEPGTWNHIAVVVDPQNAFLHCYLDGEYIQSNSGGIRLADMDARIVDYPMIIGNDNRPNQIYNFKGKIDSIALFSDVRTPEQIKADSKAIDTDEETLISYWEFDASDDSKNVSDESKNGLNLIFNKIWLSEEEMNALRTENGAVTKENAAYSFAVLGDTQCVALYDVLNGTTYTKDMFKWIADNAASLKLKEIVSVGDITNNATPSEWNYMYDAAKQLSGKVGYALVRGNHDVYTQKRDELGEYGDPTLFNTLWSADSAYMSQFSGTVGGTLDAGNCENVYTTVSVGDTDWLFIGLDWGTERREVEWAKKVVETHPSHKVAIFTHAYLHGDGSTIDEEDTGSYASSRIPLDDYLTGEELWEEFISQYENIALVFSGHQEFNHIAMTQSKGVHGNTVSQFLIDQQSVDWYYLNTAKEKSPSLVTMLYFSQDGKTVSVEQYSPIRNQYYFSANQFTFNLDADVDEQNTGFNGYEIAPSGSGSKNDPYIIENGGNLIWMSNKCTSARTPAFDGKYFKQICDIDLNTCAIKSIGNCYNSDTSMAAFGGHYDGGGYSIKNGRIVTSAYSHAAKRSYAEGLFGVICGATVENVVLENIDVWGNGVTGGIVGRAIPFGSEKNVISTCKVTSDCNIYSVNSSANRAHTPTAYDDETNDGVIGAVCGMAHGTEIKNCVADTDIVLCGTLTSANVKATPVVTRNIAGGIVGIAGAGTNVEYCAFNGSITATEGKIILPYTVGGIVGLFSSADTASTEEMTVTYCYNNGTLSYSGSNALANDSYFGGIVGYAPNLGTGHRIEHCYNGIALQKVNSSATANVGGIVGKAIISEGCSPLYLYNCASVAVNAGGNGGTNEYRIDKSVNEKGEAPIVADTYSVRTVSESDFDLFAKNLKNGKTIRHGDVNLNFSVNLADALSCTRIFFDGTYVKSADLNGDSKVSFLDVIETLKLLAK